MLFGSVSQEPLGLPKFGCYFLSSLFNLPQDAYIIYQKVVDNFEIEHKNANFAVGGAVTSLGRMPFVFYMSNDKYIEASGEKFLHME